MENKEIIKRLDEIEKRLNVLEKEQRKSLTLR